MTTKQKIIGLILLIGTILIAIFYAGLSGDGFNVINSSKKQVNTPEAESPDAKVVSTSPEQLEGTTVLPNQTIEITFNAPFQNKDEMRYKFEPQADAEITLSDDRKTVKITPKTPFKLGQGYTMFITSESKFDGNKRLPGDVVYHFSTIAYKGI